MPSGQQQVGAHACGVRKAHAHCQRGLKGSPDATVFTPGHAPEAAAENKGAGASAAAPLKRLLRVCMASWPDKDSAARPLEIPGRSSSPCVPAAPEFSRAEAAWGVPPAQERPLCQHCGKHSFCRILRACVLSPRSLSPWWQDPPLSPHQSPVLLVSLLRRLLNQGFLKTWYIYEQMMLESWDDWSQCKGQGPWCLAC